MVLASILILFAILCVYAYYKALHVEYVTFSSPCIEFQYPADYTIRHKRIVTDHKDFKGRDVYGTTSILLTHDVRLLGLRFASTLFDIRAGCGPNFGQLSDAELTQEARDDFDKHVGSAKQDSFTVLTINNYKVIKVIHNAYETKTEGRIGSETASYLGGNYVVSLELHWTDFTGNFKLHPERKKFEKVITSVQLKNP